MENDYKSIMENNYWFKRYNITPIWDPNNSEIHAFIHDEVVRQGHNTNMQDGMEREKWMYNAWQYAQACQDSGYPYPTLDEIISLGKYIEPSYNRADGFRLHNVYIGDSTGAPPGLIDDMMIRLVSRVKAVYSDLGYSTDEPTHVDFRTLWNNLRTESTGHKVMLQQFSNLVGQILSPDAWYLCFEAIHPFADGNGRTGKILHNWLRGTLNNPVLISDYFGGGNP
jgi:hypothetical protein